MQRVVTSSEVLKRPALPYRAWLSQARRCALAAWFPLVLTAAVLVLYAPSIAYPVHWDDPSWYAQGQGMSLAELLRAVPTYQFYRPLTMHVAHLLTAPGGVVRMVIAHVLQIGTHLAIALGTLAFMRQVGLARWPARLGALIVALHPFSFQAVAWQGAHQPLSTLAAVASVLAAYAYAAGLHGGRRRIGYLLLSLAAYAAGLLLQESVLPLVWVFGWIALDAPRRATSRQMALPWRKRLWPLGHLALACAYAAIWLGIPRTQEITGQGFQPIVLAYLLQGVVFPLGWPLVQMGGTGWPVEALLAALAAGSALLVWAAARGASLRIAALGALWAASGIAPVWAGLGWDYVKVGPRLFYAAAPGVAILFAAASPLAGRGGRRARTIWMALLVALPLAVCLRDGADQQSLAEAAFAHQSRGIDVMASRPNERLLFVNYPDRLELRAKPYPLGFWGLVLAPVAQSLADYAQAGAGVAVETRSLSAAEHGWDARDASPFRIDMRGVQIDHDSLREAAAWADAVYLTEYAPDGAMRLVEVGHVGTDSGGVMAQVGERLDLVAAEALAGSEAGTLVLRLAWRLRGPGEWGDTLFVHVLDRQGRWVAGADGDALGGLLPMVAWPNGGLIVDERIVSVEGLDAGEYRVTVGAYNRDSGQRYRATDAGGAPIADGEVTVAMTTLP